MKKKTILDIMGAKGNQRLVCSTAYTYPMARMLSDLDYDLLLVGDSAGMEIQGYTSTVRVTLDDMLYHLRAVVRGNTQCFVVADMPFLTASISPEDTLLNAGKLIQAGADAVKIEAGRSLAGTISRLTEAGIPVMGHIGLNPQKILKLGSYRVQGKTEADEQRLLEDAAALQDAGIFSVVLECMPSGLSARITETLTIPTIGIGAGPACDGQILVCDDIIGLQDNFKPKFVKPFGNVRALMLEAFQNYRQEVRDGRYPDPEHSYE